MGLNKVIKSRIYGLCLLLIVIMLIVPGLTTAIRPTSATYDKSGVVSTIDATCIGTFMVDHDMSWEQGSLSESNLNQLPMLDGEKRSTTTYREGTSAIDGSTTYRKDFSMDGSNASVAADNLEAMHVMNYQADTAENGRLIYEEQSTIQSDGSGTTSTTEPRCVFASGSDKEAGGYSSLVSTEGLMDVQEVAAVTTVGGRSISATDDVPVSLRYGFDAKGLSTSEDGLAVGQAGVKSSVHTVAGDVSNTNISTDYWDRQSSSASGLFDLAQTVGFTSTY